MYEFGDNDIGMDLHTGVKPQDVSKGVAFRNVYANCTNA